jgi:hypothetical protein
MSSTNRPADRCTSGGTPAGADSLVSGYLATVAESSISLPSSSSRLSPRSLAVLAVVRRFRLISASQVHRMAFPYGTPESSGRRMRRTMERLLKLGLVKRLPRPVAGWGAGSEGYIYQPIDGGFRSAAPHVLAVTEIFVRLIEAEQAGTIQLVAADPEPYGYKEVGHVTLKPDLAIDFRTPNRRLRYWLEVDLDSERRPQLRKKMSNYCLANGKWATYHRAGPDKTFPIILFIVPDHKRKERIQAIAKNQDKPELFEVVLFEDAVARLTS